MSFSLNALTAVVSDKKEKQEQRAVRELKVEEKEREGGVDGYVLEKSGGDIEGAFIEREGKIWVGGRESGV